MQQTQTMTFEDTVNVVANKRIPKAIYSEANISKNGVVYFPFTEEQETIDWIDNVISEWWDDETI